MRLVKLAWVWAVVVVSVLTMATSTQHKEERHLSYEVSPKVPFPSRKSTRDSIKDTQEFSDLSSVARLASSLSPSGIATSGSTPLNHSSEGRDSDNVSHNNLYYSLISSKKKEGKSKNKRKNHHHHHHHTFNVDRSHHHHQKMSGKDLEIVEPVPTEESREVFNHQSSIKDPAANQNVIFSTGRVKMNTQRPQNSNQVPSIAYPSISIPSKQTKTSETTTSSPWKRLSRVPATLKDNDLTNPGSFPVNRYPYSTTFHSFDSFLNTIGTSLKLDGNSHAIRTRSDDGVNSLQESHHSGTIHIDLEGAPGSSQDLYENNALGIDVLEQDKATFLNMPERCCGSKVPFDPEHARPIGGFSRVAAAGSIKVVEVPDKDTDILSPSVIRDLKVAVTGPRSIRMDWTAPGDDLDYGKVTRYVIRLSDTRYDLRENRFDQAVTFTEVDLDDLLEASGVFQDAGTAVKVTFNVDERVPTRLRSGQQYYVALRALDDFNNTSPVSNVATFTLPILGQSYTLETTTTTTTIPTPTTTSVPSTTTTTTPVTTTTTAMTSTSTEFSSREEYTSTESGELENQIVPIVTLEGHVIPNAKEQEQSKRRKGRKGKGKGRKNRDRKGKKGKKNKKGHKTSSEEEEVPSRATSPPSSFDPYNKYDNPGCYGDSGQRVTDGRLCDAISALLTVIDYFEHTREYKHLDYLSNIVVTLRHRAQPHWRGT